MSAVQEWFDGKDPLLASAAYAVAKLPTEISEALSEMKS